MAVDPGDALQRAVVRTLTQDQALTAAFEAPPRVYDRVPSKYVLPYITLGDIQILDDSHCEAAWEAFVTVHVWSDKVGKPEAQRLGALIGAALSAEIAIDDFVCVLAEFREKRVFSEPDGLTVHGVVTTRYLIDQA